MKIFCVGRNKTGTTSMAHILRQLGYNVGNPAASAPLFNDWVRRDFKNIVKFCNTADAFQDIPFSLDYTFQVVDDAFPDSKFILTVRDSADQWYHSLTKFHSKIVGATSVPPTAEDLRNFKGGWLLKEETIVYGVDEGRLYDPNTYKKHYDGHNQRIIEYFKSRPDDLLVINLNSPDVIEKLFIFLRIECTSSALEKLCSFLHIKHTRSAIKKLYKFLHIKYPVMKVPHVNKGSSTLPRI